MGRQVVNGHVYQQVGFKPEAYDRLSLAVKSIGEKRFQKGIVRIVDAWMAGLEEVPVATFDSVMAAGADEDVPVVLCGRARSGKSHTLKLLLQECLRRRVPFLLVDTVIEHAWMPTTVNFGDAMSIKFTGESSYRVVLDAMPAVMQEEMKLFFGNLNSFKLDGRLKRYVIAVEESHRFVDNRPVYDFVAEAGKWTRKTIVVASNPDLWKNVAIPMRPYPRPPQ
jgi:hypothetical protein